MPEQVSTEQLSKAARFLSALNDLSESHGMHLGTHSDMHVDENTGSGEGLQYLLRVRWDGSGYVVERPVD